MTYMKRGAERLRKRYHPSIHFERRSTKMAQGFQQADHNMLSQRPKSYFFYGSLMDAATLQTVLSCRERPRLRSAKLRGYHCKMWGKYPAIIHSTPKDKDKDNTTSTSYETIPGKLYEPNPFEHIDTIERKLQNYEGVNYRVRLCFVQIEGEGEVVEARTFEWVGEDGELRDGVFDLRDYLMGSVEIG